MKFSIIIPVYNVEKYLKDCLDSVMKQTYGKFEVVAVNDGSTDKSGKILDEYAKQDNRIKVIHQKNQGLGGARNTGISYATGDYFIFLDSDDYIDRELLEILEYNLKSNDVDILVYGFISVDEEGNSHEKQQVENVFEMISKEEFLLLPPSVWNKAIRRGIFEDNVIKFPERIWYEDLATTLRFGLKGEKIGRISKELYFYRQRVGSIMHNANVKRSLEIMQAFDIVEKFYEQEKERENYYKELEYLCYLHVIFYAAYRLLGHDYNVKEMKILKKYCDQHFPNWKKNQYTLNACSKNPHMKMLANEKWLQFYMDYGLKNKIKKNIKKFSFLFSK